MNKHLYICDCCGDSISELYNELTMINNKQLEERVRKNLADKSPKFKYVDGMIDMLTNYPDNLTKEGKFLFDILIDYLQIKDEFFRIGHDNIPSLWDFVMDYLHLSCNSGYDYFLMCYLDTYKIIEHGSGIRCSWLVKEWQMSRTISEQNRIDITTWIDGILNH